MTQKRTNGKHTEEFSRRSHSYESSNIIQKKAAKKLIEKIDFDARSILDLGCGSGAVFQNISWPVERFVGIDKAANMCKLHPNSSHIHIIQADFEDPSLYTKLDRFSPFDLIVSSSALQWAHDLPALFEKISILGNHVAFAIFCEGTFRTIRQTAGISTFLPNIDNLERLLNRYFDCRFERWEERLYFPDNLSKFRYIKRSGVSGGERRLGYRETKRLIREYPLEYLEFEILFAWGEIRR
ncbi:MAG: hypothetical protein B6D59_05305 [Campylobacteraceae bacterium 4484_4]|nr:MAG: hypothetical protein B6D59_05305 [Campylobacteraceae bacterium 4484_4]